MNTLPFLTLKRRRTQGNRLKTQNNATSHIQITIDRNINGKTNYHARQKNRIL